MSTNASEARNSRELGNNSFALAVAVIRERIDSLPKEDRDDLYELLPSLFCDDSEEVASAQKAFNEILDGQAMTVQSGLGDGKTGDELQAWIDYVSVKIRDLRKKAEMTQEALADKSGIPQSHLSRLEQGKHSPTAKTLRRIASALDVPVSAIDPSGDDDAR